MGICPFWDCGFLPVPFFSGVAFVHAIFMHLHKMFTYKKKLNAQL